MGGIAPPVMKRLREEQQKQDAEWFDGFVEWMTEGDKVFSAVAHFSDRRMCKLRFRNADTKNRGIRENSLKDF